MKKTTRNANLRKAVRTLRMESLENREFLDASSLLSGGMTTTGPAEFSVVAEAADDADAPIDLSNALADNAAAVEKPSLIVNSTKDVVDPTDGVVTLREAVEVYAQDGDTITFASIMKGKTITLDPAKGPIAPSASVTIDAINIYNTTKDVPGLTIGAKNTTGIFDADGADLELVALKLKDYIGPAVYGEDASITLVNSEIVGGGMENWDDMENPVFPENYGAAFLVDDCNLTIRNSRIHDMTNGSGGAIGAYNSSVTIENSEIYNCFGQSYGGAISISDSTLTVSGSVFYNNQTYSCGGVVCADLSTVSFSDSALYNNKAIFGGAGAIYSWGGSLTIDNTDVRYNVAGDGWGGAIAFLSADEYSDGSAITLQITDSAIYGNVVNSSGSLGGAVYVDTENPVNVIVDNSVIYQNEARFNGGALALVNTSGDADNLNLVLTNTEINDNVAGYKGGAIYAQTATISIEDSDLSGNQSQTIGGGAIAALNSAINVDASILDGNIAGVPTEENYYSHCGWGGAFNVTNTTLVLTNSELKFNECADVSFGGGAIFSDRSTVIVEGSTLAANTSIHQGGAIYACGSDLTVKDSFLFENKIEIMDPTGQSGYGGAIYVDGTEGKHGQVTTTLENCCVYNNEAQTDGGAIFAYDANAVLRNVTITGNTSGSAALAARGADASVKVYNSIVAENSAKDVARYDGAYVRGYYVLSGYAGWSNGKSTAIGYDASKPLFADAANDDYSLADGSKAIDRGYNAYVKSEYDLTGAVRIQNGTVDLGAFESDHVADFDGAVSLQKYNSGSHQAILQWTEVPNAVSYKLLISKNDGQTWAAYANAVTKASAAVNGIYANHSYQFKVLARMADGSYSECVSEGTIEPINLVTNGKPYSTSTAKNVALQATTPENVEIRWYYITDAGDVEITDAYNKTSYKLANADYEVRVVATGFGASEGFVSTVSVARPTKKITVTNQSGSKATLLWSAIPGAASYSVKRSVDGGQTWITYKKDLTSPTCEASGLYSGKTYMFSVTAYDAAGKAMLSTATCTIDRAAAASSVIDEAFVDFFADDLFEEL